MASLASLLNPSDSDGRQSPPAATQQMPRKDSLPPIQPVQSHGSAHTSSPGSTRSGPQQFAVSSTAQEAAQALASLSTSPAPPPTQWNGYSAQDGGNLERQRSWDRASVQLPPPTPIDATRKNSSPTLEQYHFASSHSPDQRRESTATPRSPNIVLPPLQGFVPDQVQRQSHGSAQESLSVSAHQLQTDRPSASLKATGQAHSATVISSTDNLATLSPAAPAQLEGVTSFVAMEVVPAAQLSPPPDDRASDVDAHVLKAVATLKSENIQRTQSPLRETSVPVPSTEDSVKDEPAVTTKKRPAPAKTKKGTASTVKKDKAPPAKKRRVDTKRADTPSSRASKAAAGKSASVKGTPINSSPAPSIRSYSAEPEEQDDEDDEMDDDGRSQDGDLYCICRKPDNGQFMIGCDGTCDDWFHGKCVGVPERDKNLIDKYICPGCTTKGVGRTTWKRMCRRSGCRQPAKTGKNRNGAHGSKYCSEECGVLYFREMVVKTRGAEESASRRAARRKGSLNSLDKQDEDVGARGGALAAGEVKALLNVSSTAEDFRKLGDGVLSPPATPDGNCEKDLPEFSEHEARELEHIEMEKEIARLRHTLLKDRMKFVTLAKQAASRVATERELKPKEYCGYDPRIEWSEQRFQRWRTSKTGRQAFELDTLAIEKIGTEDDTMVDEEPMPDICDRKKCARHMEWSKLAVDDIRFEMSDNGDRMRSLDRDEHDIKERAALRSKTGALIDGGSVEVHGLGITTACQENKETGAQPANSPDVVPTVEAGDPMAVDVL